MFLRSAIIRAGYVPRRLSHPLHLYTYRRFANGQHPSHRGTSSDRAVDIKNVRASQSVQRLIAALKSSDLRAVPQAYMSLAQLMKDIPGHPVQLSSATADGIMGRIVMVGQTNDDAALLRRVINDRGLVYEVDDPQIFYKSAIRRLLYINDPIEAMKLALSSGHSEHEAMCLCHSIISECIYRGQSALLEDPLLQMLKDASLTPINETYLVMLGAVDVSSGDSFVLSKILGLLISENLPFSPAIYHILKATSQRLAQHGRTWDGPRIYCDVYKDVDHVFRDAEAQQKDLSDSGMILITNGFDLPEALDWRVSLNPLTSSLPDSNRILFELSLKPFTEAVVLAKQLYGAAAPPPAIGSFLLKRASNMDDVLQLEHGLAVSCEALPWSTAILDRIRQRRQLDALSLLRLSNQRGALLAVDPRVFGPMMKLSTSAEINLDFQKTAGDSIAQRQFFQRSTEVYNLYAAATSPDVSRFTPSSQQTLTHAIVYHAYVGSLSLLDLPTSGTFEFDEILVNLGNDMNTRGVKFILGHASASFAIALMRRARDFNAAFYRYKHAQGLSEPGIYSSAQYWSILNTFVALPFGVPPATEYFAIVQDMRRDGHSVSAEVYRTFLTQVLVFLDLGQKLDINTIYGMYGAVQRTHKQLLLDPSFTPDTSLWNFVMQSYQRVGAFHDAYRVWDSLHITRKFDHASISIMFDACGFAKQPELANKVFRQIEATGFKMNLQNWNTLIECLCRNEQWDQAIKVVCVDMGGGQYGILPDVETIRIMQKFAFGYPPLLQKIRHAVKRFLPELWSLLPHELKSGGL